MRYSYLILLSLAMLFMDSGMSHASDVEDGNDLVHTARPAAQSMLKDTALQKVEVSGFAMLPRDVLLLICSKFETPAEFGNLAMVSKFCCDFISKNIKGCAIIIGTPGSGKTCIANLMVGNELVAKKKGKRLVAQREIPGLKLTHSRSDRSKNSHLYIDTRNKEAIFDCRGFKYAGVDKYLGLEKSGMDIDEARSFKRMLRWKIRVILVEKHKDFEHRDTSFNVATWLFPKLEQLKQVLRLVIVGDNSEHHPDKILPDGPVFLNSTYSNNRRLPQISSKKIYEMVEHLIANPARVARFHQPTTKGVFKPRNDLVRLLQDRTYVLSPPVCSEVHRSDVSIENWFALLMKDGRK